MNIGDAYAHPLFNAAIDARTGFKTRNILCCGVSDVNETPIAVLQVGRGGGRTESAGCRQLCGYDSKRAGALVLLG
jgi:hypothetical protein